jgi:hypothetical protein
MTRCLIFIASLLLTVGTISSAGNASAEWRRLHLPERTGSGLGDPSPGTTPIGLVALDSIRL